MDVINEIIRQSAIGPLSRIYRNLVLSVFTTIIVILFAMLLAILLNASQLNITYGY